MKIAIIGTRGIPNHHGGFEQFAEFFAVYAQQKGHEVSVYNSHNHPFQGTEFKGVKIIHCYDPEDKIGTSGQFIYDLNSIRHARKRNFDIILQLGYTSSSIWGWFLPKKAIVVTNMDGLEWKRSKYSPLVQKFLRKAENWAVKTSDYLIADSLGIQNHLAKQYNVQSKFIAYGANTFLPLDREVLKTYQIEEGSYYLIIARMEPENNIEMILDGFVRSGSKFPFIIIGNTETTSFGKYLRNKFENFENIKFLGAIYDLEVLNHLRYFSRLYFHGHSVGGTNPSLLEAMSASALIAAHNNIFNKSILDKHAFYFKTSDEVANLIKEKTKDEHLDLVKDNLNKIEKLYSWELINKQYLDFLLDCHERQHQT